jgi:hypothetical protein
MDSRHGYGFLLPGLFAGVLLVAATGICDTYTVGSDGVCSAPTIGEALLLTILNPGKDLIRIADNQTYTAQQIVVSNQAVSLVGGYDTCSDNTTSGATVLSGFGGSSNPVISIDNTTITNTTIELVNLTILAGEVGGIDISGDVYVTLENTVVTANDGSLGGGITIDGTDGAVLAIDELSQVTSNNASDSGGGIHCSNSGIIGLWGRIYDNEASNMGGGIYLNNCTLNAFGAASSEIADNRADLGGGILATAASTVNLLGEQQHPFVVTGNQATTGGGLYLMGYPTTAELVNCSVVRNTGTAGGGGFYISSYAELTMDRDTESCSRGLRCSTLENNANGVAGTAKGGAIAVRTGGRASIRQTYIAGNQGDARGGIASVDGTDSFLLLEGVVVYDSYPGIELIHIDVDNEASVRLAHVSTAGNVTASGKLIHVGMNARIELLSSVFGESAGQLFDPFGTGGTGRIDCVIAHELASAPVFVSPTRSVVNSDPSQLFVAPASGQLHLRASSPAIDFCSTSVYVPTDDDIDNEVRGWDDPTVSNGYGTYDIGADERRPLFTDGFESGDTSAWSVSVP